MTVKIASVFNAIQGEGKNQGMSCTFIRLYTQRCFPNGQRCKFCDTVSKPHLYKPTYTLEEIKNFDFKNKIVITGGEFCSLTNEETNELFDFLNELSEMKHISVDIETNGSYFREERDKDEIVIKILKFNVDVISVSPKLKNSGITFEYDFEVIRELVQSKCYFKFVVSENFEDDMQEIDNFISKIGLPIENNHVYLMPKTPCSNEHMKRVYNECIIRNWNFSPRLHMLIYGDVNYEI